MRNRPIDTTGAINRVTRTLLNLMRIEVLLGIGLVLWVFSLELHAENYTSQCLWWTHDGSSGAAAGEEAY